MFAPSRILSCSRPALPVVLIALAAACGSGGQTDAPPPTPAEDAATPAAPMATSGGFLPTDEGKGTVWIAGVEHENFAGSCGMSRRNGREEMGDLTNREGMVVSVAIDNVASAPPVEMNFVALTDSTFRITDNNGRVRGTIDTIAYESALTPKGTSQAIARVSFTGATVDGVSVVAHVVCEIQNRF